IRILARLGQKEVVQGAADLGDGVLAGRHLFGRCFDEDGDSDMAGAARQCNDPDIFRRAADGAGLVRYGRRFRQQAAPLLDKAVGTGEKPRLGKTVVVHYTGTFTDGTKFDSSLDSGQPYEFRIGTGTVIRGWEEGILSMHVGGKRKLIVPPDLGYGAQGKGKIPPNATLIFE